MIHLLYPEGWRFREFVGIFRNSAKTSKKIKINDNSIVDQVMAETSHPAENDNFKLLHSLQQQVLQLVQQQGGAQADAVPVHQAQG